MLLNNILGIKKLSYENHTDSNILKTFTLKTFQN